MLYFLVVIFRFDFYLILPYAIKVLFMSASRNSIARICKNSIRNNRRPGQANFLHAGNFSDLPILYFSCTIAVPLVTIGLRCVTLSRCNI